MRAPHLAVVSEGPDAFASLFAAAAAAGMRVGWLEWGSAVEPPPSLASAAVAGALRAVAVGQAGSLAVKRRRGPPVLADLVREHFAGCRLVLIKADAGAPPPAPDLPRLEPAGDSWRFALPGVARLRCDTPGLIARLRSPRPIVEQPGQVPPGG